jgi:putative addiction module component (TIGR02574 family)
MLSMKELISEATSLPVEERVIIVDSLLRSLNPPDEDIDKKWTIVAKRRLEELRSGKVKPVSGDEVFAKVWKQFSK